MDNRISTKNKVNLPQFYEWLLCRAREMESEGSKNHRRLYQKFAEIMKLKMNYSEEKM